MFCVHCGKNIPDHSIFCQECGKSVKSITANQSPSATQQSAYKVQNPIGNVVKQISTNGWNKKKIMSVDSGAVMILFIILVMIALYASKQEEQEKILFVKNGSPTAYPTQTYGDVFDNYCEKPKWRYFEASNGEDIVEFTGSCFFRDKDVDVRLQFILNIEDGTFDTGYLSFNDVTQDELTKAIWLSDVFENY